MTEIERMKGQLKNDWGVTRINHPFSFIIPKIKLVVLGNDDDLGRFKDELMEYGAI
jgi:hypothetical protein